jgi:POT family proton-dependent oligopeptide transporter
MYFSCRVVLHYKLSPVKYASLMMGVYFAAATGLGNKVAGIIGESASDLGEYSVFLGILVFTLVVGSIFVMSLAITTPHSWS